MIYLAVFLVGYITAFEFYNLYKTKFEFSLCIYDRTVRLICFAYVIQRILGW